MEARGKTFIVSPALKSNVSKTLKLLSNTPYDKTKLSKWALIPQCAAIRGLNLCGEKRQQWNRRAPDTHQKPDLHKDRSSFPHIVCHFLSLSCKSMPGGTLLWQIGAKDKVAQRLVPLWIKQENTPYRDDSMNLEVALTYTDSFYWHLWRDETRYFCHLPLRLKSKGSQTMKSRHRNAHTIKKPKQI